MATMRDEELAEKETALIAEIERLFAGFHPFLPWKRDVVIIHQDSFAAD